jgi:hypothetical protein
VSSSEPGHPVMELDRSASTLLDVLVETGHLDEKSLERVNDLLLDVNTPDGLIRAPDLRRVVADVLFDALEEMDPESRRVVETEWPLLFH